MTAHKFQKLQLLWLQEAPFAGCKANVREEVRPTRRARGRAGHAASAWLWDSLVSTTNFRKQNKLVLSTTRRGRKARITTRGAEQTLQVVSSQAQTPVFSAALTKAQESPSTQHRAPAGARPTTSTSEQPRDTLSQHLRGKCFFQQENT